MNLLHNARDQLARASKHDTKKGRSIEGLAASLCSRLNYIRPGGAAPSNAQSDSHLKLSQTTRQTFHHDNIQHDYNHQRESRNAGMVEGNRIHPGTDSKLGHDSILLIVAVI